MFDTPVIHALYIAIEETHETMKPCNYETVLEKTVTVQPMPTHFLTLRS